ncbi:Hydroxyacylglutathione hydrolase [Usitatibacter rugosus]|uniref:Hydroxyacylglutathione hydrolase n=1 Tax=Usitatibacter rugosus TaxID=2732067 RepID=A0A6M4GV05_9PROT|nr:MBL fold metallo-hydrolase [Usitatibacter rugosus]QJR10862.1 Hydroxyacylglutathione hydrolase [Usitatibacter rugosus]
MSTLLPPTVRALERGWLNCNQVLLFEAGANVLIDSGYCTHREETLALLAGPVGLDGAPLERLINTHCHSDHMGGNAAVAHVYGCSITVPEGEVKHIVPWTPQSAWMAQFDQRADPFFHDETIAAGDTFEGGGLEWEAHAAPGHDMDALMFFEPRHRILISGDALWENAMGFVWPEEGGTNPYIEAAFETLSAIEALDPAVVIPGHGAVFAGARGAIETVRSKLEAFSQDPRKNARHVVKVMFVFSLLDRGTMAVDEVPGYLARVECHRQMNERFLGLEPQAFADWLLADLVRAGAVHVEGGAVRATSKA